MHLSAGDLLREVGKELLLVVYQHYEVFVLAFLVFYYSSVVLSVIMTMDIRISTTIVTCSQRASNAVLLLTEQERAREGSEYGELINSYIKDFASLVPWLCLALDFRASCFLDMQEGKLVPVEITIALIKQADVATIKASRANSVIVHL